MTISRWLMDHVDDSIPASRVVRVPSAAAPPSRSSSPGSRGLDRGTALRLDAFVRHLRPKLGVLTAPPATAYEHGLVEYARAQYLLLRAQHQHLCLCHEHHKDGHRTASGDEQQEVRMLGRGRGTPPYQQHARGRGEKSGAAAHAQPVRLLGWRPRRRARTRAVPHHGPMQPARPQSA